MELWDAIFGSGAKLFIIIIFQNNNNKIKTNDILEGHMGCSNSAFSPLFLTSSRNYADLECGCGHLSQDPEGKGGKTTEKKWEGG